MNNRLFIAIQHIFQKQESQLMLAKDISICCMTFAEKYERLCRHFGDWISSWISGNLAMASINFDRTRYAHIIGPYAALQKPLRHVVPFSHSFFAVLFEAAFVTISIT